MSGDEIPLVAGAKFQEALHESGCPLCFLRREAIDELFSRWVWDYIGDPQARDDMRRGLGLCPEHTWQLYRTDIREYDDALGVSIVYQELIPHVAGLLREIAAEADARNSPDLPWWKRLSRSLRRLAAWRRWFRPASSQDGGVLRAERCRVCVYGEEAERRDIYWLVQMLADEHFRALYAASDGLCLPHLRRTLALAMQTNPDVARFLAGTAERKLTALCADLAGYTRSRAYDRRCEPLSDGERDAPRRAAQFFGGLDGWNEQRRRLDSI